MSQQQIEITAKLYKCREQQVFLSGKDGFVKTFNKWKPIVDAAMNKHNCSELEALIELLRLSESKPDSGMLMHILNAVVCEMLEPSLPVN